MISSFPTLKDLHHCSRKWYYKSYSIIHSPKENEVPSFDETFLLRQQVFSTERVTRIKGVRIIRNFKKSIFFIAFSESCYWGKWTLWSWNRWLYVSWKIKFLFTYESVIFLEIYILRKIARLPFFKDLWKIDYNSLVFQYFYMKKLV